MNPEDPITPASLPIIPTDAESPVPLYYQIETDLRRLISSGHLPPGATLPPEMELCQLYGVGRHTMRMALSRLAADDLISRRAGRGTVVKPQADRMKFYLDRSFTHQMADMGLQAHSKVLDLTPGRLTSDGPEVFRDKVGRPCLYLMRLRLGGAEPIGLQATTILTDLCPGLEAYDFNQHSLYDILSRQYQLIITEIRHTISATIADDFQAEHLTVEPGDPLLVVKTAAYLDNGQVVEHTVSHYRADKYEYSTTHVYTP